MKKKFFIIMLFCASFACCMKKVSFDTSTTKTHDGRLVDVAIDSLHSSTWVSIPPQLEEKATQVLLSLQENSRQARNLQRGIRLAGEAAAYSALTPEDRIFINAAVVYARNPSQKTFAIEILQNLHDKYASTSASPLMALTVGLLYKQERTVTYLPYAYSWLWIAAEQSFSPIARDIALYHLADLERNYPSFPILSLKPDHT